MFQVFVEYLFVVFWISFIKPVISPEIVGKYDRPKAMVYSDFPFYVQVLKFTKALQAWHYLCGGTLIASSVSLTACHCVSHPQGQYTRVYINLNADSLVVIGGTQNPWFGGPSKQDSYIKQIMAHPHCAENPHNITAWDVAALLHFKPFRSTNEVRPLMLFSRDPKRNLDELLTLMAKGEKCHVIGNRIADKKDQTIEIAEMVPQFGKNCRKDACEKHFQFLCKQQFIDSGQVCMKPAASRCIHSSGGPIFCKGYLFGVVSWPGGCLVAGYSVDANVVAVTHITNWYSDGLRRSSSDSISPETGAYSLLLPTVLLLKHHMSFGFWF